MSEAGRRPAADLLARASLLLANWMIGQIPARCRSATSFGPVCEQDSVTEFGLDQLRTGMRLGSSRFELSRHVGIARTCSNLVADRFEAKFHYAIWSQTGPRLVADLLARASLLLAS